MATLSTPAADAVALLDVRAAARLIGVSARSVRRLADCGRMPAPLRLTGGLIRWRRSDLDEWIAAGCPSCRRPGAGRGARR